MRLLRLLGNLPSCASDGFRDFLEHTPPGREAGRGVFGCSKPANREAASRIQTGLREADALEAQFGFGDVGRGVRTAFPASLSCLTIASEGREAWAAYCPCAAFSLVWFCWRDLVSGWTGGEAERETIDGHVYLEEFIALGFRGAPDLLDGREAGWRGRGRFFGVERMRLELVERRRGLLRRVLSSSLTRT